MARTRFMTFAAIFSTTANLARKYMTINSPNAMC